MNEIKELRIDCTLWATPSKLVNLLDLRYENGGFYLTMDNLRGYFNFSNNLG